MRIHIYEHVTAGGLGADVPASLRCEGQAMLDAVVADFQRIPGVELTTAKGPDTFCLVIAPEFDDHLRRLSQDVLDCGGQLLGSLPRAIATVSDKYGLARIWNKRGVPRPYTDFIEPMEFAYCGPPWVVKPRCGAGSQATYLIHNYLEAKKTWMAARVEWQGRDLIVQKYVAGQAVSVALLMGPVQTIPLMPARQHLSDDDRLCYLGGSLPLPEPLAERATKLALQSVDGINGLRGYVGVDLVLGEDGTDYAIEINPRLTTSYLGLRQLCEQNLAELMLCVVRGEQIEVPTWKNGEVQFRA